MRSPAAVLSVLLLTTTAPAQPERYELGKRLKAFEAAWDAQPDAAARKRALKGLPDVTQQFFTFRFGEAGRTLDDARFALESDQPPSEALRWATSLYPDVPKRLIDGSTDLTVNLKAFYTVKGKPPAGLSVRCALGDGKPVTLTPDKLPAEVAVPLPPAGDVKRREDLTLTMAVLLDGKAVVTRAVGVSVVDGADALAGQLLADVKALKAAPSLETASVRERARLLRDLAKGDIPETDAPAAQRLAEATETLARAKDGKPFFTADRPGDHWLTVPTGETDLTPCRLFVPKGLDPKKSVPLVVAMHGAGGSENLFFEGYGAGHIVKLCEKRGWLLVAPRAGMGFGLGGTPPVGEIIDRLAERYPIDPKAVFVVGHSMGASMAVEAVQKYPGRFAAAAVLGGGGRVRKPEAFAEVPVFVGVGDKDFALRTAKGLHKALTDAKAKAVTYKEYPDVEHLVIVREALGDVVALFEKSRKR
jgi:predicted esterase